MNNSIAVIGLGAAGLPLAAVIASNNMNVIGVDINSKKCDLINHGVNPLPDEPGLQNLIKKYGGGRLKASTNYSDAANCTVYIIIVPLFIDENHLPDYNHLHEAVKNIGKILKRGDVIVVETTVPPYTTETLIRKWLEEESNLKLGDFYLACSPERIMTGYSISRLKDFPKVVGGVDKESGLKAYNIYKKFIPNIKLVSSARVAEFIKIIEGCYRDVNIALANELFKIASILQVDFKEAREYANHAYCNIHQPSTGVGGHCIPYYPWFLIKEAERRGFYDYFRLLKTAREINDEMVYYWIKIILENCLKINKPLTQVKICVNGITFRKGVKNTHYSRNMKIAEILKEKGFNVYVSDELLSKKEIETLGFHYLKPEAADLIFDSFNLEVKINPNPSLDD